MTSRERKAASAACLLASHPLADEQVYARLAECEDRIAMWKRLDEWHRKHGTEEGRIGLPHELWSHASHEHTFWQREVQRIERLRARAAKEGVQG